MPATEEISVIESNDIHALIIGTGITGLLIAQGLKKVHPFLFHPRSHHVAD